MSHRGVLIVLGFGSGCCTLWVCAVFKAEYPRGAILGLLNQDDFNALAFSHVAEIIELVRVKVEGSEMARCGENFEKHGGSS